MPAESEVKKLMDEILQDKVTLVISRFFLAVVWHMLEMQNNRDFKGVGSLEKEKILKYIVYEIHSIIIFIVSTHEFGVVSDSISVQVERSVKHLQPM